MAGHGGPPRGRRDVLVAPALPGLLFFKDRRILEIGPGAGVDGMPMAELGAKWTFADIVPENLANLRRLAALKGVDAGFHQIGEDLSFDGLEPGLLEGRLGNLAAPYEFEVTLRIEQGAVGIGLADASGSHLPDTEIVARASSDPVTITLRTGETPAEFLIRNRHEDRESRFTLLRAIVREAP